ncbi:phage/plasmid primase, P4 family [Marispirochaeta sp.]|uniref:phage/plasmid primase, P4 family n=1 Tax=Marispirochaeta sp. TaxID=2038653 RepID=UPI0037484160
MIKAAQREAKAEREKQYQAAAEEARKIWSAAKPADPQHPYLQKKQVKPHNLRQSGDNLLVPIFYQAKLCSIQYISPDCRKKFHPGGRTGGSYSGIGTAKGAPIILIAEGWATSGTLHEATGHPAIIALNAGNLLSVAQQVRKNNPSATILVCADDDFKTGKNPGLTKAREAAEAVKAHLAVPAFGPDRPEWATDYNDLAASRGAEVVREQIEKTREAGQVEATYQDNNLSTIEPVYESPAEIIARTVAASASLDDTGVKRERNMSDLGNSERVADRFHRVVKYIPELNTFAYNDGTRFVPDTEAVVFNLVKLTVRDMLLEARNCEDSNRRRELIKWAARSEDSGRLNAAFKLLESEARVITPRDRFDTNPWDINLLNGVYNAQRDEFRKREHGELFLQVAGGNFDPTAKVPKWNNTLEMASAGRRDWIDRLRAFLGYGFTGDNSAQVFAEGSGKASQNTRNMKSTVAEIIRKTMGSYCRTVTPEVFLYDRHRRPDGPRPELAQLPGVRMVLSTESPRGGRIDVQLMKRIFGGDPLQVRQLYGKPFEFEPVFKLFMFTNHKLGIGDFDEAISRRVMYFPFDYQVPKEKCIPHFAHQLLDEERDGILAWFLTGAGLWAASRKFPDSQTVDGATAEYLIREDTVGLFVKECCLTGPQFQAYSGQLFESFKTWAERSGEPALSQKRFSDRLEELGFKRGIRKKHGIPWIGIGIQEPES